MAGFDQPPPWLRWAAEHVLVAVDPDTLGAAYTHLLPAEARGRRSYWIKVSSVQGLERAIAAAPADVQAELRTTLPYVFLMPHISLAEAQRFSDLMISETEGVLGKKAESSAA